MNNLKFEMNKSNYLNKTDYGLKVFEAFAGYGGANYSLKKSKLNFSVVGFSEIDKHAIKFYENNHPNIPNFGDITLIDEKTLPDFNLFTGGFPCQPFSSVGLNYGEDDTRGTLFHDIIRICNEKRPKHILLENVKGLKTNKHGRTLKTIITKLSELGYDVIYKLLNSKDYGIPQNRDRLWIYGYNGSLPITFDIAPEKQNLSRFFKDYLDSNPNKDLYKNQEQIKRLKELYKVDFLVNEPSCVDLYNKNIRSDGISVAILEPHHNKMRVVEPPIGQELRVRKYSVDEHFRLMGFTKEKLNYGDQSYQQLCKMASNGWDINLVSKILNKIFSQVEINSTINDYNVNI